MTAPPDGKRGSGCPGRVFDGGREQRDTAWPSSVRTPDSATLRVVTVPHKESCHDRFSPPYGSLRLLEASGCDEQRAAEESVRWFRDDSSLFQCQFAVDGGRKQIGSTSDIGYAQPCVAVSSLANCIGRYKERAREGIQAPRASAHVFARLTKPTNPPISSLPQTPRRLVASGRATWRGAGRIGSCPR